MKIKIIFEVQTSKLVSQLKWYWLFWESLLINNDLIKLKDVTFAYYLFKSLGETFLLANLW